jgi:tetratricopeptide (TPR) repeat protein
MSLLLDALKKAADDKQKASIATEPQDNIQSEGRPGLDLQDASDDEELTLDIIEDEIPPEKPDEVAPDETVLDGMVSKQQEMPVAEKSNAAIAAAFEIEQDLEDIPPEPSPASNTVSDEALSLLISKTNREVKNSKRYIVIAVILLGITVLFAGGIYYYFDMQAEMDSLERKHNIAMQAMRAKTGAGNTSEKSEIIRNFVNKAEPEENVKLAKKHLAREKKAKASAQLKTNKTSRQEKTATVNVHNITSKDQGSFSVQKTNKADPLGDKLEAAWQAYESGQYERSEMLYLEVLRSEKNNRDAMLGLAATAIHNNEPVTAKKYYQALLKLDPRDPIATAGIASLHSESDVVQSDEAYILGMLEKNPDAAPLNFALGNIYAQKGEWKSAQKYYFNAWKQDGDNADYLFNMAISMDQLGKPQQALKFYRESLLKSKNRQAGFSRKAVQQRIDVLTGS